MADVPDGVQRDHPPARLTGGRANEVGVVGSGSNLLIADTGVRRLALKLDHELSQIPVQSSRIDCGGGARLPAVSALRSCPTEWSRS